MNMLLSSPGIFFALGLILARLNKNTHFPKEMIRIMSLYLVLGIGLKGGQELTHVALHIAAKSLLSGVSLGLVQGAVIFYILKLFSGVSLQDGTSIAAHYGSVSVGTFMVAVSVLKSLGVSFETDLYLFLVSMECPAILMALALYQLHQKDSGFDMVNILRKVFYHETILALLFGLIAGCVATEAFLTGLKPFYDGLFVGVLTFFMVAMGMEAGNYWGQMRSVGYAAVLQVVLIQLAGGVVGLLVSYALGLSVGGAVLLMVLMGSASYIAAPCVMRESVPEANNSAVFLLSLGVTFPINVLFGIKLYLSIAQYALG